MLRHDHVREEQLHVAAGLAPHVQCLDAVVRLQHAIAKAPQAAAHHRAHRRLILHQQHRCGCSHRRSHGVRLGRRGHAVQRREEDAKRASLAWLAHHLDPAPMLCDESMHGSKPESSALAHVLRGEERLEEMFQGLRCHAGAGVRNLQQRKAAGLCFTQLRNRVAVTRYDAGTYRERAPGRHRIARVEAEVDDHLLDHPRIPVEYGGLRQGLEIDDHPLSDEPRQHAEQVAHHHVEIVCAHGHHLATAEHQQLAREVCGALRRAANVARDLSYAVRQRRIHFQQLELHGDGAENVVEVVGDAAGQLADGVHALCMLEALLARELLRDVALDRDVVRDDAGIITQWRDDGIHDQVAAVTVAVGDAAAPRFPALECCPHARVE